MGEPTPPNPALLLVAAFSRHAAAIDWARRRAEETWGPVKFESPRFIFDDTDYYQPTMGSEIQKQFFVFDTEFEPNWLADVKLLTNIWELEYAQSADHEESRPLNLDPGYLCLGKLVLASTKDHAHRIYLSGGIYGEVTLHYRSKRWQPAGDWTFADYRREDYHEFFSTCREYLHEKIRKEAAR